MARDCATQDRAIRPDLFIATGRMALQTMRPQGARQGGDPQVRLRRFRNSMACLLVALTLAIVLAPVVVESRHKLHSHEYAVAGRPVPDWLARAIWWTVEGCMALWLPVAIALLWAAIAARRQPAGGDDGTATSRRPSPPGGRPAAPAA